MKPYPQINDPDSLIERVATLGLLLLLGVLISGLFLVRSDFVALQPAQPIEPVVFVITPEALHSQATGALVPREHFSFSTLTRELNCRSEARVVLLIESGAVDFANLVKQTLDDHEIPFEFKLTGERSSGKSAERTAKGGF